MSGFSVDHDEIRPNWDQMPNKAILDYSRVNIVKNHVYHASPKCEPSTNETICSS